MKEIKQIEELDKIVDDYIGINSDNHICECGNRHSVESCKQLQMSNALMNILVTAVDEALATQKAEHLEILIDEIAITHTSKRGTTSGLSSAYMRIKLLTK